MSVTQYTAEELISIIRIRTGVSDNTIEGCTDPDLLAYLNSEALSLYARVQGLHADYFTVLEKTPFVANRSWYRIPHRAMWQKLRSVNGITTAGDRYLIPRFNREDQPRIVTTMGLTVPFAHYIESTRVVFVPDLVSPDGSFEIAYFFRPGQLVLSTDCRQVKAILNAGTGQIQLASNIPGTWTTSVKYDIHSAYSGAEPKAWSLSASATGADTLTLGGTSIDGSVQGRYPVEVGDWVCLEEQAALPGLPREWHPILAQKVVCKILESKDKDRFQISVAVLRDLLEEIDQASVDRNEGQSERMNAFNSPMFGR